MKGIYRAKMKRNKEICVEILSGSSRSETGRIHKITASRVSQIFNRMIGIISPQFPCLINDGKYVLTDLRQHKEALIKAIAVVSVEDLESKQPELPAIPHEETVASIPQNAYFACELSTRAQNILRRERYKSKEDVKRGIESGTLNVRSIRDMGSLTYAELCRWVMVSPSKAQREKIAEAIILLQQNGYTVTQSGVEDGRHEND